MSTFVAVALALSVSGCGRGTNEPKHRERAAARDVDCRTPERPRAYMYPATDRTNYGPDNPKADRCEMLVPDHLFCCPPATRATDR